MKIAFILLSLLFAPLLYAANMSPPLNLEWNMSAADLEQQGIQLTPVTDAGAGQYVMDHIENPPYSHATYIAEFNDQGKLNIVAIKIALDPSHSAKGATEIENGLNAQYGKPSFVKTGQNGTLGQYHYINWGTPETGYIAYTYASGRMEARIAYFAPKPA